MTAKEEVSKQDFLLELWVEEMPAGYVRQAVPQLKSLAERYFGEKEINFKNISVYGTPNRLVLYCENVPVSTPRKTNIVYGPPKRVISNENERFTVQAVGFARKHNMEPEQIEIIDGRAALKVATGGDKTIVLLSKILPEMIARLEFPKTMVWEETQFRFARPIRNMLAMLGRETVRFCLAQVKSSNKSLGLHVYSDKKIPMEAPAEYFNKIKNHCVIIDPEERKKIILKLSEQILKKHRANILFDEKLIGEICFLVENPVAVLGAFRKEFLDLPDSVLINCLKDKQKFLPVVGSDGGLLPLFVGFRNGISEYQDIVREGYERVLEARLKDVEFFFSKDKKSSLESKIEKLKGVIQNEKLGSLHLKTERIVELSGKIADILNFSEQEKMMLKRAALLSKADLVSEVVFEYPELQGIMGGIYAKIDGEPRLVADAVAEHYAPNQLGDPLPQTKLGKALAVADKIDSVSSSFVLGYVPKGSGDPYGLRRMVMGVISIILENKLEISLREIIQSSLVKLPKNNNGALENMLDFVKQRFSVHLTNNGFDYDHVDAVLSVMGWCENLVDSLCRLEVLREVKSDSNFEPFVLLYRRASNILRQAEEKGVRLKGCIQENKFQQEEEKILWRRCQEFENEYSRYLADKDYKALFIKLVGFKNDLNCFFDKVLVMAEDEELKINRLKLIERFRNYFKPLADFSKIVLKEEKVS